MKASLKPPTRAAAPSVPVFTDIYVMTILRRRPLWRAHTAQDYLIIPNDAEFLKMIDEGKLCWAWDIGASRDRKRKEVRVLAHCIVEQAYGPIKSVGPTSELTFAQVVDLVVSHHRANILGTELQRMFACSPQHIADLGQSKELSRIAEQLPSSGPAASRHYTRESVVRFLETRRIL